MNKKSLSRGEKWFAGASVVVIASVVGGVLFLQAIDAEPQIAIPAIPPLPSPNGLDVYREAARSMKPGTPPVDPVLEDKVVTDPRTRAQRYALPRREAWLKANAKVFALFRKAKALPCVHPTERGLMNLLSPSSGGLRAKGDLRLLARCKAAEANTFALRGDWNGAVRSNLDIVQLGIDMPRGGGVLAKLTASAIAQLGMASVAEAAPHLSAPHARVAARRLEALLARRVTYVEIIREEKWDDLQTFIEYSRLPGWRTLDEDDVSILKWLQLRVQSRTKLAGSIERNGNKSIAEIQKPYSTAAGGPQLTGTALLDTASARGKTRMHAFSEAREKVHFNLLLLELALRAYAEEHGGPPRRLAELAPGYLKTVPTDAFADGAPFRYAARDKTYRLWSVGPDMKDNGGTPFASRAAAGSRNSSDVAHVSFDSKGDWVITRTNKPSVVH